MFGGAAGLGGPDHDVLVRRRGAGQGVPVQGEVTDQRVPEPLVPGGVDGDLAGLPPALEVDVVGHPREQAVQSRVVRATGRVHPQMGHAGAGAVRPVAVTGPQYGVVEEQPHVVAVPDGVAAEVGEQGGGGRVPGEHVHGAGEDEGRSGGELGEQPAVVLGDLRRGACRGFGRRPSGQAEQIGPLVGGEAQGPGESLQYGGGGGHPALLDAGVVVGADRGQPRDLRAPQPRDPPRRAVGRQPDLLGGQLGPAGAEECPEFLRAAA